jgi:transcriptional regulator with XRE-family HTH domain
MKAHNIHAAELARRLGCDHSVISNWLAGRRSPGVGYALGLQRELGLDPNIWVSRRGRPKPRRRAAAPPVSTPAGAAG